MARSQEANRNQEPFVSSETIGTDFPRWPASSPNEDRELEDLINQTPHEPRFCLPEHAIDYLAQRRKEHPPRLGTDQVRLETAFTRLCRQHFAIGFLERKPLRGYSLARHCHSRSQSAPRTRRAPGLLASGEWPRG